MIVELIKDTKPEQRLIEAREGKPGRLYYAKTDTSIPNALQYLRLCVRDDRGVNGMMDLVDGIIFKSYIPMYVEAPEGMEIKLTQKRNK